MLHPEISINVAKIPIARVIIDSLVLLMDNNPCNNFSE
jgi:hypothetical protein